MNTSELQNYLQEKFLTGGRRTTAQYARDFLGEFIDSTVNIEDGGYVFQSVTGYTTVVSISDNRSFAHKKYVDDAVAGVVVDVLGTSLTGFSAGGNTAIAATDTILQAFQNAQGQINSLNTSLGNYVLKSGSTMTGNLLFTSGLGIDTTSTGGTDVINIGAANADVVNIGRSGATVNILGTAVYEYATNAYVTDKLITLNSGGAAASALSSGIEVEENSVITGYIKTTTDRNGWTFLAPGQSYAYTLSNSGLTGNRTYNLPNFDGTFATLAGAETLTNKESITTKILDIGPLVSLPGGTPTGVRMSNTGSSGQLIFQYPSKPNASVQFFNQLTTDQNWDFPNQSGIVALTSDITNSTLFVRRDGTFEMTDNWDAGDYYARFNNTIIGGSTKGIYVYHGSGVGEAAAEFVSVNTKAVNASTSSANVYTAYSASGSGFVYSGGGRGLQIETSVLGIDVTSSTSLAVLTQSGQLSAANTSNGVSIVRAFNPIGTFASGTATNSAGGTSVTGSGTSFTTLFSNGDRIVIAGEVQTITSVNSNTSLTTTAWVGAHTGANYSKVYDATGPLFNLVNNTICTGDIARFVYQNNTIFKVKYDGQLQYAYGTLASGKVLTSDANGNITWQTPSAGTTYTFSTGLTESSGTVYANISTGVSGGQTIIGGTDSGNGLIISSTSHATKGLISFGTSVYNEANNRLGIGTTSPSSAIDITTNSLGVTQTATSGIAFVNTTAATSGNQQITPAARWSSNGWGTTAGTSQDVSFIQYGLPIQSTTPNGALVIDGSTSGGAYSTIASFYNTQNFSIGTSAVPTAARQWVQGSSNNTTITSPGSAQQVVLYNSDTTANNFFGYTWYSNNTGSTPMVFGSMVGIYKVHTTSSESFEFAWLTRTAGTLAERMRLSEIGNLGIQVSTVNAKLHIAAGGTGAGTGQILLDSGSLLSTKVAGSMGYIGNWYITKTGNIRMGLPGTITETYTSTGNVGTTPTDIFSYSVEANTFNTNGDELVGEYYLTFATATILKSIQIYFGAVQIFTGSSFSITNSTGSGHISVRLIRVSSSVLRYRISVFSSEAVANDIQVGEATGLTLSNANTLRVSGVGGAGAGNNEIVGYASKLIFNPATA